MASILNIVILCESYRHFNRHILKVESKMGQNLKQKKLKSRFTVAE